MAHSTRSIVGTGVTKTLDGASSMTIEARAAWSHEFSPLRDIRMRLADDVWTAGFNLAAPRQQRESGLACVTFAGSLVRSLRFFVTIDSELSGPLNMWSGNAGLTKTW